MFVLQVAVVKERGGIVTAMTHYERMFRAVGVRSALVFSGPSASELVAAGFDVIEAPSLLVSPIAALPGALGALKRAIELRAGGEDIFVLLHSDKTFAALRAIAPRASIISPCHTDKSKHKAGADLVITLNLDQHALVSAALPRTRVRMLGNPFVPLASQKGPAEEASGPIRFNFLGRFEGFKDPLTLISAFGNAPLPHEVTLRMIGAGPMEAELREAASRSGPRVEFAGWLPDAFSHFDARDVLVLPSSWESYSYVVREALHFGVPVIASNIHVHREALADGAYGRLFPVADTAALTSLLLSAIGEAPTMRAQAAQGGDMVRATYGAAAFFNRLTEALQS